MWICEASINFNSCTKYAGGADDSGDEEVHCSLHSSVTHKFGSLAHVWVCLCSSLVSTEFVPTPYRCSSIDEVEAWLKVFASSRDIPFEELKVFSIAGSDLLSLTKDQCRKLSRSWGVAIYCALREGTASSNLH